MWSKEDVVFAMMSEFEKHSIDIQGEENDNFDKYLFEKYLHVSDYYLVAENVATRLAQTIARYKECILNLLESNPKVKNYNLASRILDKDYDAGESITITQIVKPSFYEFMRICLKEGIDYESADRMYNLFFNTKEDE